MQSESRDRVHQQRLAESRALARAALQIDRRFHVDERQWNEFGKTAGARLQRTDPQQVSRPIRIAFDVAEHDRRRRLEAYVMRGLDGPQPGISVELIRADHASDVVVENLR